MDPFVTLDLEEDVDKAGILKQVTQALRDKRYDAKTIAEAQKQLFNPLTRAQMEFRYRIAIHACAAPPLNVDEAAEHPPKLKRLLLNR
ncbi:MAG: hypothetical protein ABW168_02150 [Sedimenticola sp.]